MFVAEERCSQEGVCGIRSLAIVSSMAVTLVNFRGALIRKLTAQRVRVYALAPDFNDDVRGAVRALGAEPIDISLERTGMRLFRDVADFVRLTWTLRRLRPDAVLAYFIKPVIYGCLAAWLAGIPRRFALVAGLGYVFTDDGQRLRPGKRLLRQGVALLYQAAFAVCEKVFFQNDDDLRELVKWPACRKKSRRVNGSGVDLVALAPAPPVTKPVTFLLMGRLLREKGIREYVAAAREIKERYPDVRFLLVGQTDTNPGALSQEELEAWVACGVIEWPGHVADVRPWIERASVYVLPSYREGVPRSTQEAMAMARPVITTDAPGCRETVEHGVTGYLVPVRDVSALRDAMLRFVEAPELIEAMGKASRRLAEQRFDVEKINALMLDEMGIVS